MATVGDAVRFHACKGSGDQNVGIQHHVSAAPYRLCIGHVGSSRKGDANQPFNPVGNMLQRLFPLCRGSRNYVGCSLPLRLLPPQSC